ncbi:hypothetical protein [Azospirillum sp. TSO5]|uniref:hypothetical protein n=1 Tax=Azospirillum sp. TSO5 TaxID=716760 RepID=UPI001304B659|nr:hypothetical protein [Azospirillum sp. TSO5]
MSRPQSDFRHRFIIHCSAYVGIALLVFGGAWAAGRLHHATFSSKSVPVERITKESAR